MQKRKFSPSQAKKRAVPSGSEKRTKPTPESRLCLFTSQDQFTFVKGLSEDFLFEDEPVSCEADTACNNYGSCNDCNDCTGGHAFELSDDFGFNCATDGAGTLLFTSFLLGSFLGNYPVTEGAFRKNCFTDIASVVVIFVSAFGNLNAADVTVVVLVCVYAFSELSFAGVTLVIVVGVSAFRESSAAGVTLVILVGVCAIGNLSAAGVTLVQYPLFALPH